MFFLEAFLGKCKYSPEAFMAELGVVFEHLPF